MECSNKPKSKSDACNSKSMVTGKWSPIYSQALLVELDNGKRFLSNFRYNLKDSFLANPLSGDISKLADLSTGSEEAFDSQCSETMVGYVQNDFMNTGKSSESMKSFTATCFHGQQVKHAEIETTKTIEEGEKKLKYNKIMKHNANANFNLEVSKSTAQTPKKEEKAAAPAPAANQAQVEEEPAASEEGEKTLV